MIVVLVAVVALGSTGLLVVPSASRAARAMAALALLAVFTAALDPRLVQPTREAPRVRVFADAATAAPLLAQARAAGADAAIAPSLATAVLAAGPRADEALLLWPAAPDVERPGLRAFAGSPAPILPWDPAALAVAAPAPLAVGRPGLLEVSVPGAASPVAVDLRLTAADGAVVLEERVLVLPGGAATVRLVPARAGTLTLLCRAECGDAVVRRAGTVAVLPDQPILVVEAGDALSRALRTQDFGVRAATALPADLQPFAAVVLARDLPAADAERLAQAVADGLGLFVTGAALDQAAWRHLLPFRLEPLPPAEPRDPGAGIGPPVPGDPPADPPPTVPPPDPPAQPPTQPPTQPPDGPLTPLPGPPVVTEVEKRAVAMVLVIDRSTSMRERVGDTGRDRMSYAKRSALATATVLGEGDLIGLVGFGQQHAAVQELPLTDATDRATVQQGVEGLQSTFGTTFVLPGLQEARQMLADVRRAVRHVVVITDGEFFDPKYSLTARAREMRRQGLTISIVEIAGETRSDPVLLEEVARAGGGRWLQARDASQVPFLVSAEVTWALDRIGRQPGRPDGGEPDQPRTEPPPPEPPKPAPPPTEPPAQPPADPPPATIAVRAVADSELLLPRPQPEWPGLAAARRGAAHADAQVLLVAGAEGHPLLAFANRGLGRVAAFAADLGGADGSGFRAEAAFPARLGQWVGSLRRPATGEAPAGDLLAAGAEVTPPRPGPAVARRYAELAGAPLRPLEEWPLPGPRPGLVSRGLAPEWALPAALVLLLLALVEFLALRRPRP